MSPENGLWPSAAWALTRLMGPATGAADRHGRCGNVPLREPRAKRLGEVVKLLERDKLVASVRE